MIASSARRTLAGLVGVICPAQAVELGLTDDIVDHVELSIGALPRELRAGLLAGLTTYELGAIVRHGKPASRLDLPRARRYYAAWRRGLGVQREFAKGIQALMALACYEMPAMQQALGYQPDPWIDQVKRRRLAMYQDDIQRHRDALVAPEPLLDALVAPEPLLDALVAPEPLVDALVAPEPLVSDREDA